MLGRERRAEAWHAFEQAPTDVLITDWMMPGLAGPELCRRVRQRSDDGYTYVILATSLERHEHVLEGMEAGADDYLTKPIEPFDLQTRLIAAQRVTELHKQVAQFHSELARLNIELGEQARTDPLTRLGNRMRLHEDLSSHQPRAVRTDSWYCLAICDLDSFKHYNDTFGHLAGDGALRRVADVLANASRDTDSVYRYGGEEFVVLLRDTAPDRRLIAMERLRQAVEGLAIPHEHSARFRVVTISSGVARARPTSWRLAGRPSRAGRRGALPLEGRRPQPDDGNRTTASDARPVQHVA